MRKLQSEFMLFIPPYVCLSVHPFTHPPTQTYVYMKLIRQWKYII